MRASLFLHRSLQINEGDKDMFKLAYGIAVAIVTGSLLWVVSGRWEPDQISELRDHDDPVKVLVAFNEDGEGVLTRTIGDKIDRYQVKFAHAEGVTAGPVYEMKFVSGTSSVPLPSITLLTHPVGPNLLFCTECKQQGVSLPSVWELTWRKN